MATLYETFKRLEKTFEPIQRQMVQVESRLEPIIREIEKNQQMFGAVHAEIVEKFSPMTTIADRLSVIPFAKTNRLVELLTELEFDFKKITPNWDNLPRDIEEALLYLAKQGWFFPVFNERFVTLFNFHQIAMEEKPEKLDEKMVDFLEGDLDNIEKYLIKSYPHRRKIFNSAFKAHRKGDYELAILAFFSQVDGICWDAAKYTYFQKRNSKPLIGVHIQTMLLQGYSQGLTSVLTNNFPISYNHRERGNGENSYSGLNRHTVMHGECLDYGTKENSFKAISLLYYVALALEYISIGNEDIV
ncbi:MAG: hypothetical protein GX331_11190 [Firmicutes bacterium]|nr:hypothetical protein [Bacillota bacterium]